MNRHPPVPPIFVWTPDKDLAVFDVVGQAESHFEAIDVRYGGHFAFDAEGRRLRLGVERRPPNARWWEVSIEHVVIDCEEETPSGQQELREILETFLREIGQDAAVLRLLSLSELGGVARQHAAVR